MDYISLNVIWLIANGVLAVLYKTILSKELASRQLFKLGNSSVPFLQTLDKAEGKQIIAVIIFVIFTIITIKKYTRDREKDALGIYFR